ncbi:MAG TPA: hypothetical protein VNQ99_15655, partial [Xanthobacteraceae bacterium]|nr:hypothetical protein [Xanthobacteraceae bacterium]
IVGIRQSRQGPRIEAASVLREYSGRIEAHHDRCNGDKRKTGTDPLQQPAAPAMPCRNSSP